MNSVMKLVGLSFLTSAILMGCENPVRLETKVHEDGSLDKTIILEKIDSMKIDGNVFGANEGNGWTKVLEKIKSPDEKEGDQNSKKEYKATFKKSFPSAEAANLELDKNLDTLFRIHSSFEKSFRWFYTYIRYSEIYGPFDRLKKMKREDYFNQEDKSFINRLPGEGTAISKADSFFLENQNEKIFKNYARMGMFLEYYDILTAVMKKNMVDKKWLDTLYKSQEMIYKSLEDMEGDPFFAAKMADSLHIPLPREKAAKDFESLSKDLNSRITFMSFARDGKYVNIIEMPWTVVDSNADSVAGNQLYWKPLATKFAIQEYEMFAEARKLNWWAVGVSVIIIGITLFIFFRKRPDY